jgi:hypothetical protein
MLIALLRLSEPLSDLGGVVGRDCWGLELAFRASEWRGKVSADGFYKLIQFELKVEGAKCIYRVNALSQYIESILQQPSLAHYLVRLQHPQGNTSAFTSSITALKISSSPPRNPPPLSC